MSVFQRSFQISTRGRCDVLDITPQVGRIVAESKIRQGLANVSGQGSTVGVTTIEYEPGAVSDLARALEKIAPSNSDYAHNARWGDDNGFAHLRSALLGTSQTFPVGAGELGLGTWQQIVFCDFDDRPRQRQITVTVIGE
jgi:secondary thiamine-phosphate synthase enzyme